MSASTKKVEVVPIKLEPHPNADRLSLVRVFDNYVVVVATDSWKDKELGAYIIPDMMVPTDREEFSFLDKKGTKLPKRITAEKIRQVLSEGLLVPAPEGAKVGDDVAEKLGVTRYEIPVKQQSSSNPANWKSSRQAPAPSMDPPCYDLENFKRYSSVLEEGETIVVTEKIEGANGRWVHDGEKFHAGSHYTWKEEDDSCDWWKALKATPELMEFLEDNPNLVAYGEIYGKVGGYSYGVEKGTDPKIALFDLWDRENGWEDAGGFLQVLQFFNLPHSPILYVGPYSKEKIIELTEGDSVLSSIPQIREGVVIKPWKERKHDSCGRVALKSVSSLYLSRKKNRSVELTPS